VPGHPVPAPGAPASTARRRLLWTVALGAVLAAAAIGGILIMRADPDDQTDYDEAVAQRFLSVCRADAVDAGFADAEGFCRCTYDRIRVEIPYDRFVEIDAALADDPGAVPDEIDRIRTACFADSAIPTSTPTPSDPGPPAGD